MVADQRYSIPARQLLSLFMSLSTTKMKRTMLKIEVKVGLYHRHNQINEMNDSRGGRCFESPLK